MSIWLSFRHPTDPEAGVRREQVDERESLADVFTRMSAFLGNHAIVADLSAYDSDGQALPTSLPIGAIGVADGDVIDLQPLIIGA